MAGQSLAIVNPHPERLPGPQLLHDFALQRHINVPENHNSAIDFLSADGQRTKLSYSELNLRSDQLAAILLSRFAHHGILKQHRIIVPVFLSQSPELYVSLLAVLKAGAGFCPQALDAPEDRLKFVFQDVDAKVLLTTTLLRPNIPHVDGLDILCIDDDSYINYEAQGKVREQSPHNPAYVLYTSGSTGTPKGVVLSHDAVTQSLLAHDSVIPPFSRFLQFASPTFDVSMFEIFFTFFRGATLIACDRKRLLNDLPSVLNEMSVDGAELTPTVAGSLLRDRGQVPSLKVLLTIGEMLTRHVIDEFGATDDKKGLLQGMYGPTEAAIHCTLQTEFKAGAKAGSIGLPLTTVSAFIIASLADCGDDPTVIRILKVGEVGELAVGGHQLADGYLNRPEQTKAAFIQTSEHGILYRTGDKARLLEDGTFECLGRISSGQIKLRGMRMELGEIEHAAATAKGCRVTVASVLNQNLVVFCLTDGHTTSQIILEACKKWLPTYMMPNDIIIKTELPQLPSGKIDRKRLDAEYLDASKSESNDEDEDLDAEERAAADALQTSLGAPVTLNTKLSQSGLDSLSAIRVASILRRSGYNVGAIDILTSWSLANLGKLLRENTISELQSSDSRETRTYDSFSHSILQSSLLRKKQDIIQRILPCTPVQASMLAETKQNANAYCNWVHIELDKATTLDRTRNAFLQLVRANEILRTGFAASDNARSGYVQVVFSPGVEPTICSVQKFNYDFRLSSDDEFLRPIEVQILQQAQSTDLLIHMHHSLYDGWSIDLLINDLNVILSSPAGKAPARPQFAHVVDFYQDILSQPQDKSETYWKSVLRGYVPAPLPQLSPDSTEASELHDISCSIPISIETLRLQLPQGCHPQSIFQGVLSCLLSSYLGKQDIVFGTVTSGRTIPVTDIEEIIGPCMATLPLRVAVDHEGDFRQLLKSLSSSTTAMLSHGLLPLHQIKTLSGVLPGQPFFDVLFIWQESLQTRHQNDSNARLKGSKDNLEFSLVFEVEPQDSCLRLKLSYKRSLWSTNFAASFLQQIEALSQQVIRNRKQSLFELAYSIPNHALSAPLLPRTSPLQQVYSHLSVPEGTTIILANKSAAAYYPVPRGAVGQICWTRSEGSFDDRSRMQDTLSSLEATGQFARMLLDSSLVLVDNESAKKDIEARPDSIAEINASVESSPHAEAAQTASIANEHGFEALVTFWVPIGASSKEITALELTSSLISLLGRLYDHLSVKLPPHLVPKTLIPVSKLPQQIDCHSFYSTLSPSYLSSIIGAQTETGRDDQWSEVELHIARAVADIAEVPSSKVQLRTSFFSLGVNSITAISLARILNQEHYLTVEAADLLRNPSVSRLAAFLDRRKRIAPRLDLENVFDSDFRQDITKKLKDQGRQVLKFRPCTPNQEALLSASVTSCHAAYQNHTLFSIRCELKLLLGAVHVMFSRHEILRTCFFASENRQFSFAQVVLSEFEPPVEMVHEGFGDHLNRTIDAIDTMIPPVSITIEDSKRPQMLLSMHHALYDKQAVDIMLYEVEQVCKGNKLEQAPSFDEFLQASLSIDLRTADQFWSRLLRGYIAAPVLSVADDNDEDGMQVISQTLIVRRDKIDAAAKKFEVAMLSIFQAAWAVTLSLIVDESDVCFGNAVSGRTIDVKKIDRLVAPCFNTVPVRADLSQTQSPMDIVKHLHNTNTKSLQYQFTPLRRIQNQWSTEGGRLIDSMFLLQGAERPLDQDIWRLEKDFGDMGIPVICEVTPHSDSGGFDNNLHFQMGVLSEDLARQVLQYYQDNLKWIVGLKDSKCHASDLVPELVSRVYEAKEKSLKPFQKALKDIPSSLIRISPSGLASRTELLRYQKYQISPSIDSLEVEQNSDCNEVEVTIRKILASLAQVSEKQITKQRTIFQLGLDSISAIQVAKALRSHDYNVNAEDILANPTITTLGTFLEKSQKTLSSNKMQAFDFTSFDASQRPSILQSSSLQDSDINLIMPCTAVQAGIIAQFRRTNGDVYFNKWAFQLSTAVNVEKLMLAWQEIAIRHDVLRTSFFESDSSQHPFLAVCYSATAKNRFGHNIKRELGTRDKSSLHENAKQSVLSNMETPPWRVQITSSNGNKHMHFSALHALFDAKVLNILFEDLWEVYEREQQCAVPIDIRSAASTVLLGATDEDGTHKKFWTKHLERASTCKFPNLAPQRQLTRALRRSTIISSYTATQMRQRCQSLGITLQAALQGAYTVLLSIYTGDPGITFGIVLSGRDEECTMNAAFPTAVTLPFYAEWYDKPEDLLRHVMDYSRSVRAHQFSSLTDIHRWLNIGNTSLFDCLLVLQEPGHLGSKDFTLIKEEGTAEYTVSLEVIPLDNDEIEFNLIYWNDVVPEQHAEIVLQQFDHVLADLLQLETVSLQDRFQSVQPPQCPLLDTDVTYMHEFAERTIQKQPEKMALEFTWELGDYPKRQSWTYAELDTQANRMANFLLDLKIPAGSIVAICFDKCPEASFATFGILKSGSGFVAIDSGAPTARKAFIANDSKAAAVLTMSKLASELQQELGVPVLALDEIDLASCSSDKPDIRDKIGGNTTCYCLYTSGSTGTPKGCLISHHNAVQGLLAFKHIFKGRYTPDSRWLQFASFHFDVSVLEQFWSWMVGICVISAPRDILFEDLPGSLKRLEVTHLDLTPSLARLITPEQVPSLCSGVFITGGEQLRQEVLDTWGETGVIHNFYGPSECTIGVTVNQGVGKNGKPSNIGRQFINVGTCVLKPETFTSVLTGAPGELCLYGPLVGKGYLNRPELSEERFPFLDRFDQRIYRTGDLVRVLCDGSFDFLGRIDDQVKLRGQRLELGEINNAARESSNLVTDVHSLVIKDQKRQTEQIVLFAVFDDRIKGYADSTALERTVLEGCKSRLPPYMVPSQVVRILRAFPLTPNNKVDAKALRAHFEHLPKQSSSNGDSSQTDKALSGPEEHAVARVLAAYLKVDTNTLSGSTNMFQAGLDSISVFNFVRALRSEGYDNASASVVMQSNTISELANKFVHSTLGEVGSIMEAKQAISACQHRYRSFCARALNIDRANIETLAPCTPLQQGMIARSMDITTGGRSLYLNTFKFELTEEMDISRLHSAWARLLRSVPILRSKFVETNGGHVQVVLVDKDEVIDAIVKTSSAEMAVSPLMDPLRVTLEGNLMIIEIFHALYDAISLKLILEGLVIEYCTEQSPTYGPSFIDALPYGPLKTVQGAKRFWEEHLRQAQVAKLPDSDEKGPVKTRSKSVRLESLTAFESVRRKLGVTHQAIVQTCWIAALQTFLQSATTIGMLVSGRSIDYDSPDRIIGPMFNTLPFFAALMENDTFASATSKSHQYNVDALPYQHTALHDITKWSQNQRMQPLFNTLFVFQKAEKSHTERSSEPWKQAEGSAAADYPLAFEAEQIDDETLSVQIVSLLRSHTQDLSSQLLGNFKFALEAMLSNPEQRLADVFGSNFVESCNQGLEQSEQNYTKKDALSIDWSTLDSHQRIIAEELALAANVELSSIAPETSIFELGLDSIDAIKLSARLKKRRIKLPMSVIMREQSVSAISTHVNDALTVDDADKAHIEQEQRNLKEHLQKHAQFKLSDTASVEVVLPVTPLQEAMVAEMYASSYDHYFNHDVLQLAKGTDLDRLKEAWNSVVQANPILRTTFVEVEDTELDASFAQVVYKSNINFWTATQLPLQKSRQETFEQYMQLHRKTAFLARKIPPFHIAVVELPEQICLVLSIAHALYDGYSLGLIHQDVQRAYYEQAPKRPSYELILHRITSPTNSKAESFWKDFIQDAQPCEFPQRECPAKVHRHEMASQTSPQALQEFCKAQCITPQALAYTCWSFNVASYTACLDIVTGLVLSGREDEASQDILFPTMNTVAMRSVIHGTVSDMLQYSQSTLADVTEHQHFPLRKVQGLASGRQLFNSIFIFQRRPAIEIIGETLYESQGGDSSIEYPIAVELEVCGDDVVWRAACGSDCLSDSGTKELLRNLESVLQRAIANPSAAAVQYNTTGASVCDLPSFQPVTHRDTSSPATDEGYSSDKTSMSKSETAVCEVFSTVSHVPITEITKAHTLFHLGLDSISAIKVCSLLRSQKSLKISVSAMLRAGTVESVARSASYIEAESSQEMSPNLGTESAVKNAMSKVDIQARLNEHSINIDDVEEILPATPGQTHMLSVWLNSNGGLLYSTFEFRLLGVKTQSSIHSAWDKLLNATPVLRTCFLAAGTDNIAFIQVIIRAGHKLKSSLVPLIQFTTNDDGDSFKVTLRVHHALYDAVFLQQLLDEFVSLCADDGSSPRWDSRSASLAPFTAPHVTESERKERITFWEDYLKGASLMPSPMAEQSFFPRLSLYKPSLFSFSRSQQLTRIARSKGLSIQSIFLAVLSKTYAETMKAKTGESVLLGVHLANRTTEETASLAAPTLNLLPVLARKPKEVYLYTLASQIQQDLHTIGASGSFSQSQLWEIKKQTGAQVDVFVNFLPLQDDKPSSTRVIELQRLNGQITEGTFSNVEAEAPSISEQDKACLAALKGAKQAAAYTSYLDIEAAIRANSGLDCGLFGPESMIGGGVADIFMEHLSRALHDLMQ